MGGEPENSRLGRAVDLDPSLSNSARSVLPTPLLSFLTFPLQDRGGLVQGPRETLSVGTPRRKQLRGIDQLNLCGSEEGGGQSQTRTSMAGKKADGNPLA